MPSPPDRVSQLREKYEQPLWLLLAIGGLVLLIACANLANLLLARASAREREIATRQALGASRGRLIRQLLVESLLLAGVGAGLGAALALALSRFLIAFLSTRDNPVFLDLVPDWRVLGFAAGLAVLTCLLFGLAPAIRATRMEPGAVMKAGGRGMTASRERFSLRRALVVAQVALSLVLVAGALLFSRSLSNLLTVDTGFREEGILIAGVNFQRLNLPPDRYQAFKDEFLDRIRATPGMESLLIRSAQPQAETVAAVTRVLTEINPAITVSFQAFKPMIEATILRERLMATLSVFFGLLALLLACIGLYGILSYGVASRTNEIGIRMALGAGRRAVFWLILREALWLVVAGVIVGLPMIFAVTRLASTLLFGLTPTDPVSLLFAALLMLAVAMVAGYLPSRRATRVDPLVALRYE